jgi:hypothetical protein
MRIGLDDMDARVAEEFAAYARAGLVASDVTEGQKQVRELIAKRKGAAGWMPLGLVGLAFASIMGTIPFADAQAGIFVAGLVTSFASSIGATWLAAHKVDPVPSMRGAVTADEMKAVFPHLSLSQAERVYSRTLMLLAEQDRPADEHSLRRILGQLNTLLNTSRQLEVQRNAILASVGTNTSAQVEREVSDLTLQVEQADDTLVRQDLVKSLGLCDARLQDTRALELALRRLDAQQQVVLQTLGSAHTSLARHQVAQVPLAAPDVDVIQEAVVRINEETRSVEQAVQEVMALRQG